MTALTPSIEISARPAPSAAKAGARAQTIGWVVVGTGLIALSILSRLGMLSAPFALDSGLYVYMGKVVAEGGVLYRDFFETKLPGAPLITSIFWRLFGSHWAGYVLSQLALSLATAGLLARAAKRHISAQAALPTFLAATVLLNFAAVVFTGFQLETIQAFFEAIAALAALEAIASDQPADAFTTGLAAGTAAMLKPGGVSVAIAFAIVLLSKKTTLKSRAVQLLALIAGIAIPTAATIIYVYGAGIQSLLPEVVQQISRYANETPINLQAVMIKLTMVAILLGWPLLIHLLLERRTLREREAIRGNQPMILCFALLWFAGNFAAVLLQRRLYEYHFFPLLCPAVLLYAMLPGRTRPISVALGFLPIALLSFQWPRCDLSHMNRAFGMSATSAYVSAHSQPNDSVYADQIGQILIETGLKPGSRYGTFFYFVNYDRAPLDFERGMLKDFDDRKPRYIVLPVGGAEADQLKISAAILARRPVRKANFELAWIEFNAYLNRNYILETTMQGNDLYRRR